MTAKKYSLPSTIRQKRAKRGAAVPAPVAVLPEIEVAASGKKRARAERSFTIRDASIGAGISPSMIRAWEKIGIVQPVRNGSTYRMYTDQDVLTLRRAVYLRKYRGLNAAAIVEQLRTEGFLNQSNAAPLRDPAGSMLRRLRLQSGESLGTVAAATGISVGFLSNLERGQTSASVGTMHRLAGHYGMQILDFFDRAESSSALVRPRDRKNLRGGPGVSMELLAWGPIIMEPHLFHVEPGGHSGNSYKHEGQEFLYVMSGEFNIFLEEEEFELKRGDSFYFESTRSHRWHNPGKTLTTLLWINTPPTF